jgi:hypothetical protein
MLPLLCYLRRQFSTDRTKVHHCFHQSRQQAASVKNRPKNKACKLSEKKLGRLKGNILDCIRKVKVVDPQLSGISVSEQLQTAIAKKAMHFSLQRLTIAKLSQ